ncbi:DASH family cryptochrome [Aequorivita lipolytica]|uniref:Cryptochrome DASH n=1 Tax=Aequorivita lipolytica TaxID=153267 RepID=A0A5C6YQ02_9FLAO|nr:DASH family cryptochrome [Aequorivita lipolytica]TXD68954.1 DASH family cryptochrome [Aequorivita lipolytica]SRX53072.1 Cryptochrome DASH [Aequorivita lipolytica]
MKDTAEPKALVWFKNDLRLHDNEVLCHAIASGLPVIYLFCVDERLFETLPLGFRKADANRVIFLKQTVLDLQKRLENIGGHLHIELGLPEEIVDAYVNKYSISKIYAEKEYAWEELQMMAEVKKRIAEKAALITFWGKTLYHIDDIPFTISKIPLTSKAYRIPTGKETEVREPYNEPIQANAASAIKSTAFPSFEKLGFSEEEIAAVEPFIAGGETAALNRLHNYTFETKLLTGYRWSRNKSLGMDYSSKFSPYLALGSLSVRTIYQKVKQYEQLVKKNQSTWWLIFELVWRDYFTFKGMRMGNAIFKTEGFRNKRIDFENNTALFKRWCDGKTGLPFVDAHMRQLNKSGYMSNRGRVNCSSFLVHDYRIDWTWGAAYFESRLIDYDVSANWMNWHMQAYEIWYTNPIHQSLKYKAKDYIQQWIPELAKINDAHIYIPWHEKSAHLGIQDYPKPVEIFSKWGRSIQKILTEIGG